MYAFGLLVPEKTVKKGKKDKKGKKSVSSNLKLFIQCVNLSFDLCVICLFECASSSSLRTSLQTAKWKQRSRLWRRHRGNRYCSGHCPPTTGRHSTQALHSLRSRKVYVYPQMARVLDRQPLSNVTNVTVIMRNINTRELTCLVWTSEKEERPPERASRWRRWWWRWRADHAAAEEAVSPAEWRGRWRWTRYVWLLALSKYH